MEIVDTAGQEEFSSFRDSSVATGDAFLVLFAINSKSSWHELKDLRSKVIQDRQLSSVIPMVIVANKLVSWTVLFPRGVLTVYMTGGPTEPHFANPKKYMSLKFYTPKKYLASKFSTQKIQDVAHKY